MTFTGSLVQFGKSVTTPQSFSAPPRLTAPLTQGSHERSKDCALLSIEHLRPSLLLRPPLEARGGQSRNGSGGVPLLAVGSSYEGPYRTGLYISPRIAAATGKAEAVPHFHPVADPQSSTIPAQQGKKTHGPFPYLHLRRHWSRTDKTLSLFTIQKTVFSL